MKKASVHLLSAEDGCQSLVQVARNLSHQVAAQQTLASDICPASVAALIHGRGWIEFSEAVCVFTASYSLLSPEPVLLLILPGLLE